MKTLDEILIALQTAAGIAGLYPPAALPAALAAKLLAIVDAAIKAHEAATGQPLDLNLLKPLEPMPVPPTK